MELATRSRWSVIAMARLAVVVVLLVVLVACGAPGGQAPGSPAGPAPPGAHGPLRVVGELALPGDGSRFDYSSLDTARGLLFIAHLGTGEVIEADVRTHRVVRTIPNLPQVHGVLVVPSLHRVFATATGDNRMVILDEDSGTVLGTAPTGDYPDGLAFDPMRGAVWTTNESGGTETVIDAANAAVRGTVPVGGEVGNVAYDPPTDRMLVDVQARNELAVIDPATLAVGRRVPLPGCEHDHGLSLDPAARLAFVACDHNATLLTVDLNTWQVTGTNPVGADPDVLAYDPNAHRLYVAAESGVLTILDLHERRLVTAGMAYLADDAHVVAVDPSTGHSYYPVPAGTNRRPALLYATP